MTDAQRKQMTEDAHASPNVWYAGFDASNIGDPATACPYGPENTRMMNVWLSGHVTATDDRAAAQACPPPTK